MGTQSAMLLTAPKFGLQLALANGAPVLLPASYQAFSTSFEAAPRFCELVVPSRSL